MEPREFEVEVIGRERTVYRIQAPDAESARRLAGERWQRAEPSDLAGLDWSELDTIRAVEARGSAIQEQDDALLLRFIQERERLLFKLGAFGAASSNDAISASQAAADLGWYVSVPGEDTSVVVDTLRAAHALERLCARKALVCFERPRSRTGERGDIRLYCTPGYLERLSSSLSGAANAGG